jgi:hypothetical protein
MRYAKALMGNLLHHCFVIAMSIVTLIGNGGQVVIRFNTHDALHLHNFPIITGSVPKFLQTRDARFLRL